jgi:hypothetical protein
MTLHQRLEVLSQFVTDQALWRTLYERKPLGNRGAVVCDDLLRSRRSEQLGDVMVDE